MKSRELDNFKFRAATAAGRENGLRQADKIIEQLLVQLRETQTQIKEEAAAIRAVFEQQAAALKRRIEELSTELDRCRAREKFTRTDEDSSWHRVH